jgi:4-methylaminobutanoate oxidase (formaldehyde-forming)
MSNSFPAHAQVVIIGGGIVGCSTAYHLGKYGWEDVVLLERKTLTSGTTWAAAGLVGQLRASAALTKLALYGTELYASLEAETGQPTGYRANGSVMVAQTEERKMEYDRGRAMARSFGIEMAPISMEQARDLWPLLNTDDLVAAYYVPKDGVTDPVDTARSMAKGAQQRGVRIFENVSARDIEIRNGKAVGVRSDRGSIACERVVVAAGMWSHELGREIGLSIPLHAAEHMHITTLPIEGVSPGLPTLRDMDGYIYIREETGGLLMGGFEPVAEPWGTEGIPEDFEFTELGQNWDQFEIFMDNGVKRVPALADAQIRHFTTVPESFTPDTAYMLGEAPGIRNLYVAAGMNSVGIASAAGVGKSIAEIMTQGYPEYDLWDVDVRRFQPWQMNKRYNRDRVVEAVGRLYADHWPYWQPKTARNIRCSPIHHHLAELGACFGAVAGWERANWFAPAGVEPEYEYSWGRQNWFEYAAAEHMAVRGNVGLYDLTSMAKFHMQGGDSLEVLQRICDNDIDVSIGKVVYTQLLNERGGIEADLTVTRLGEREFFIVTTGAMESRDFDWIERHIPPHAEAALTNVTSAYAMFGVMGPKSRDLLTQLTDADLSKEGFPFASARSIDVGYARPLVLRMSYVGELGWELYIPTEFAASVFEDILCVGGELDLQLVGLHAVDSLRLEKGYRHWGSDITPDDTPFEAGLGFCVKLDKGEFIGREALLAQLNSGIARRLVMFTLEDPEPLLYHDEPIFRDGALVSAITHGAYAHLLGCSMGMGYIEMPAGASDEWILEGEYSIDVAGERVPAKAHLKAPYDPEGERVRM